MTNLRDRELVRTFSGERVDVRRALQEARLSFEKTSRAIVGECREPRQRGRSWYFDLAFTTDEGVDFLQCRIRGKDLSSIEGYLRRCGTSLSAAMKTGNVLELQATDGLEDRGQLIFDVSKIAPGFTLTGGM
ncbi:hypothetical protein, partial [Escherichia coli]|uniref:hypothetical protein n=1 Tax=Escherichia coli TaxID=562 RepID=UPI0032E4F4F9